MAKGSGYKFVNLVTALPPLFPCVKYYTNMNLTKQILPLYLAVFVYFTVML